MNGLALRFLAPGYNILFILEMKQQMPLNANISINDEVPRHERNISQCKHTCSRSFCL